MLLYLKRQSCCKNHQLFASDWGFIEEFGNLNLYLPQWYLLLVTTVSCVLFRGFLKVQLKQKPANEIKAACLEGA